MFKMARKSSEKHINVLVAGGAGYIGSHTIIELCANDYTVFCADSYENSSKQIIPQLELITGKKIPSQKIDFCDERDVKELFKRFSFDAVIHFAGYKTPSESIINPLKYYRNNLISAINIAQASVLTGVKKLLFSSSATVYGVPEHLPIMEKHATQFATTPYGNSKLFIEKIFEDLHVAVPEIQITLLRYFNPVGAHCSKGIGEYIAGTPTNLMPLVCQTAAGVRKELLIYGNNYQTPDGTCLRDFIHVVDLAKGHVAALQQKTKQEGLEIFNLGTGKPTSVLELVDLFQEINGVHVPYVFVDRRPGDVEACWADCLKAEQSLRWKAQLSLEDMVRDSWLWQQRLRESIW